MANGTNPLQEAIRILSLRIPPMAGGMRVPMAGPMGGAPSSRLGGVGGASPNGLTFAQLAPGVQALLRRLFGQLPPQIIPPGSIGFQPGPVARQPGSPVPMPPTYGPPEGFHPPPVLGPDVPIPYGSPSEARSRPRPFTTGRLPRVRGF